MPFKITFYFHAGVQGWRESWYASPTGIGLEQYVPYAEAMARKRLELLAKGVFLSHITIHDELVRQSGITSTTWSGFPSPSTVGLPRDVSRAAAIALASDLTETYHRKVVLRGLPDVFVGWTGGKPTWDNAFPPLANDYFAAIVNADVGHIVVPGIPRHPWQMKAWNKDEVPGQPFAKPVTNVQPDPNTGLTKITCPAHGFPSGKQVRIRHCGFDGPKPPPVNGVWRVIAPLGVDPPPPDWFLIDWPGGVAGDYVLNRNGDAKLLVPKYVNINTLVLDKPGSHKTGVARLTTAGARPKRF